MSAFVVPKLHLDFLVTAGLDLPRPGSPLRWLAPGELEPEVYERGAPWGPAAQEVYRKRVRHLTAESADAVGQMLLAENLRSVNHRYDESKFEDYLYEYRRYRGRWRVEPVPVFGALRCFEYQACEHPEWEASEAHAFCRALEAAAIRALPGDAPWEVTE